MLKLLFGSQARVAVLGELIIHPDRELHLRDLVTRTGSAPRSIQVEVDRLVGGGVLRERRSGNRRYLSANVSHRLFEPLRELLERSVGVLPAIEKALEGVPKIERALVFGSYASGQAGSASDVDLLIVGDASLRSLVKILRPVQERYDIEINPVVMTQSEFRERQENGEHFITTVLGSPFVELMAE